MRTLQEIKWANKLIGHHFFDKGALRFFASRFSEKTFAGSEGSTLFVSSEKCTFGEGHTRKYSLRRSLHSGAIDTEGEFQAYTDIGTALYHAARISKEETALILA